MGIYHTYSSMSVAWLDDELDFGAALRSGATWFDILKMPRDY